MGVCVVCAIVETSRQRLQAAANAAIDTQLELVIKKCAVRYDYK